MAQAANKLYSRAQIRSILRSRLRELRNSLDIHAHSAHHPVNVETGYGCHTCFSCCEFNGQICELKDLIVYFGGRRG